MPGSSQIARMVRTCMTSAFADRNTQSSLTSVVTANRSSTGDGITPVRRCRLVDDAVRLPDRRVDGLRQPGARHLPLLGAQCGGEQGGKQGADGPQGEPGGLVAAGVPAHAVGDDHQRELVVLVEIGPCEVLHEEAVLVPAALAAD